MTHLFNLVYSPLVKDHPGDDEHIFEKMVQHILARPSGSEADRNRVDRLGTKRVLSKHHDELTSRQ